MQSWGTTGSGSSFFQSLFKQRRGPRRTVTSIDPQN
jgi:hypothetical protein